MEKDFSEKLTEKIDSFLKSSDMEYEYNGDDGFFRVAFELSRCTVKECVVKMVATEEYIMCVTKIPVMVGPEKKDSVAKIITLVNPEIIGGSFIFNYDTGRIEFRSFVNLAGGLMPTDSMLLEAVSVGPMNFEAYGDCICKVACGYLSVEKAYEEMLY